MQISKLIDANIQSLKAAESILLGISDEQYKAIIEPFSANIGKHFRHITDHYQLFLEGLQRRELDYDNRDRNGLEETERSTMLLRLRALCNNLENVARDLVTDHVMKVSLAVDEGEEIPQVPSSCSRELVFLQSHTVHHYAIIAAILKLQGVQINTEFGIAPSTLKYEHQQQCAP